MNAIKSIGSAIGGLFKKPETVKPPKPVPVADPESAAARMEAVRKARARSAQGRAGTIYSDAYAGTNLAGTN